MSPAAYLCLVIVITVCVAVGWRVVRRHRRRQFSRAAGQWHLRYCPGDQFRLADRLAGCFPIVGAADLRVLDLMYGGDEWVYRYIFTVEYTLGLVQGRRRQARVVRLIEPRGEGAGELQIEIAPYGKSLLQQYRHFVVDEAP